MVGNSLRLHLLGWLLVPLGLFVAFNTWIAYRSAADTATVVQDRMLLGAARIIAEQVRYDDGAYQVEVPPAALELFQGAGEDRVYYRIFLPHGSLLLGYADLPATRRDVHAEESIYFNGIMRGEAVRIAAFAQPIFSASGKGPVLIEVAQTMKSHAMLTNQIWLHAVGQQLLMLALMVVLVCVGLWHGLAPVLRLRNRVRDRKSGALEPLDAAHVPNELAPLVDAINDYVKRLDNQMSARARFIANASHQLRTPLTVLNTQVAYARRSKSEQARNEALHAIYEGVQQCVRVVNQLLTLSTAEAGMVHPSRRRIDTDLAEIAKRVLEELAALALAKNIDLGFDSDGRPAIVPVTPTMLHELVANLADNAVRYTPPNGVVTVRVALDEKAAVLRVENSGPGIPLEDRERVFERFCRLQEDGSGAGLGLAIVSEIASASGAKVMLSDSGSGTGLVVTVTFPVQTVDMMSHARS
jgi:two-component system sensor histidine kinase TctE